MRERNESKFPVQGYGTVPWKVGQRAYDAYIAKYLVWQSLADLAGRGGFSAAEMDTFAPGWRYEAENVALADKIESLLAERAALVAGDRDVAAMRSELAAVRAERDALARRADRRVQSLRRKLNALRATPADPRAQAAIRLAEATVKLHDIMDGVRRDDVMAALDGHADSLAAYREARALAPEGETEPTQDCTRCGATLPRAANCCSNCGVTT